MKHPDSCTIRFTIGALAVQCLFVVSALGQYEPPIGYYNTATGTGATLKANLNAIIDGNVSISYSNRKTGVETLDEDPNNSANALEIYSSVSVAKSQFPSGVANTEHCWPNSYGIDDTNPAYGDLFNLRVCDMNVNSARGNKYYDDVGGTTPAHAEAPLCRTDSTRWEPQPVDKGDLARAMFYMDVRYEGDATDGFSRNLQLTDDVAQITTSNNNMGKLSTLVAWHFSDPVTPEEMKRNHMTYTGCGYGPGAFQNCQQNRNPFVDRPEFVWAVFGTSPNDSTLYLNGYPPVAGQSLVDLELPTVITGAPLWSTVAFTIQKSGLTPTTYEITTAGEATCSAVGTRQAFIGGPQNRGMTVGLNSVAAIGLHSGTVIVNNTDLTSAGAGMGVADGDDVLSIQGVVLNHAGPSFDAGESVLSMTVDFGSVPEGSGIISLPFELHDREASPGYSADLRITAVAGSGDTAFLTTDAAIDDAVAAGAPGIFNAFLDTTTPGVFSATYVLSTADEALPGATTRPALTLTLQGSVTAVPSCNAADINCSDSVDENDVEPFVDLLLEWTSPCDICTGDMDGNEELDGRDIEGFVAALLMP